MASPKVKSAGRILAEGFLEFIPYVREFNPSKDMPKRRCVFCVAFGVDAHPGVLYYQRNGKVKYGMYYRSGWYCKLHIWDAITQHGEQSRYRRWRKKYFAAIKHEIGQYKESNGTDSD